MNYEQCIKELATDGKSEFERADNLIKEMSRLTMDLLDYRYIYEHCEGSESTALQDAVAKIKNSIAILSGDMDIYMELMDITKKVQDKKCYRINRIAERRTNT